MAIIITADSSCDLPASFLHPIAFEVFPLTIIQNGIEYRDGIDISPEDIYDRVANGLPVPTTSAVNVADYYERFSALSKEYDAVIHISLGSGISSCYDHARLACEEFPNVYLVDSQNISVGHGMLALEGKRLIEAGKEGKEIADALNEMAERIEFNFLIDQLTFLHKGGRCSSIAALGANLLKLKPSIGVQPTGTLAMVRKYRGSFEKVMPSFFHDNLKGRTDLQVEKLMLVTTHCPPEWEEQAIQEIKKHTDIEVTHLYHAGCTICSHCGPKALGLAVVRK